MTPLEHLRSFLETTPLDWWEYFNPEEHTSAVCIKGHATVLYFFDGQGQFIKFGKVQQVDEQTRPNVPAKEPEPPFGGHKPQAPKWLEKELQK